MWIREGFCEDNALRRAVRGTAGFIRRALIDSVVRWQRRRATIRPLVALDDRLLADIGISRNDIDQLALGRLPRRSDLVAPVRHGPVPPLEMKKAA